MTPSSPFPPLTPAARTVRPLLALLVGLIAAALLLSGCGAAEDKPEQAKASPSVQLPTGNVEVPEDVDLTEAGTTLDFGESATVAYEPNVERSSVLRMAVLRVRTGRIADFSAYQLDQRTRKSTPYYVNVRVKNVGKGDLSRVGVPLLAVDTRDTLIQPSAFNNRFEKCPSTPLPTKFTPGKSARLCLVYLVPHGGKLTAMSFRPLQAFEPILWKGKIEPVKSKKGKKKAQKKSQKKKAGKNP